MTIAYVLEDSVAEIDEALTHAAASRRRAVARGAESTAVALGRFVDLLLDQRLACVAEKNPAAVADGPDTCQGLSPRQSGEIPGARGHLEAAHGG